MFKKTHTALPYILWCIAFTVIPLILVLFFALTDSTGSFTLENLSKIGKYTDIFVKSLNLAVISTAICFLVGFPIAFIISRSSEVAQRNMVMLIMLPMWMNFLLRIYGWMTLLENEGIINKILGLVGIGPLHMINTDGAIILGMVYNYIPFMILPLYTIMMKIDRSVIEAAQDLGASWIKVLFKVILPMSVPGIVSGITMVFVPSISTFVISRRLGGGTMLIGDLIESQFLGGTYNPYFGSAISLILMIIMLLIMSVINSLDDDEVVLV